METKLCLQCQKEFLLKRKDAKFCSSTCKAKHWETNRVERNEAIKVTDSLRGVIKQTSINVSVGSAKEIEVETDENKKRIQQIEELNTSERRLVQELKRLQECLQSRKKNKKVSVGLLDTEFGLEIQISKIKDKLASVRRLLLLKTFGINQFKTQTVLNESPTSAMPIMPQKREQKYTSKAGASQKIISSSDLKNMQYHALSFQGKWLDFFGYPSVNFHCVIHGMSGEGKSTFAVQFANYLAENFGTVLYISGEEGFSKTFKDKFISNNAFAEGLSVADLRTYDSIIKEVQANAFNFIFIDSLDNLKIDAGRMKELRERYRDSAFITISQSTKDGKMRGSYEIVHDSDMAVRVENGIGKTTKNRFKEKGMSINVF
jgi:hypothetical protein